MERYWNSFYSVITRWVMLKKPLVFLVTAQPNKLHIFPNQNYCKQACRWLVETCVYVGKQALVATKNTALNVQMQLHCQMWRTLVFYGGVCSFSMRMWCSSGEIPLKCLFSFPFQRKGKKYVSYWHISTYTGLFSWDRMLIKFESKRTWTHLLFGEAYNTVKLIVSLWRMVLL